jgi:ribosome biogenesis protein ENP2
VAGEEVRIGTYFIPQLDNAPSWCSFIENITEELELEVSNHVYDEFKFVTLDDLEKLHCTNLIGTKMLKQHLHGIII